MSVREIQHPERETSTVEAAGGYVRRMVQTEARGWGRPVSIPDAYDAAKDAHDSYYAAIEAKRARGDAAIRKEVVIGDCRLILGDCLEVLPTLAAASVDMVLADLPYGTTACRWDAVIPLEPLWNEYRRIVKPNGAIVLTAAQPFTSALISSNFKMFRYVWVWDKVLPRGHLNAKKQPMRVHEDIVVFSAEPHTYNPQKTNGHMRKVARAKYVKEGDGSQVYGKEVRDTLYDSTERYPTTIVTFSTADQRDKVHPTQKPVNLMEYLIRTYSNAGDTVRDNTMGSGTTGVASAIAGRRFIGIEKHEPYFDTACARVAEPVGPLATRPIGARAPEPKQEALSL